LFDFFEKKNHSPFLQIIQNCFVLKTNDAEYPLPASASINKEQNHQTKQAFVYFSQSYHHLKRDRMIFKILTVAKSWYPLFA
jgi:hypothetical protein